MDQQKNTTLGQLSTLVFQPNYVIHYYKNPIILNKQYNEDIIPGVYQGGFQLWQCEIELLKKMFQSIQLKEIFKGKRVCEIGCGHGLLGIGAAMLGASHIVLQDYNGNVIQQLTKPTVKINILNNDCPIQYVSGDWQYLVEQSEQKKYDIILASQVIYREQNYMKLIKYIKNNMRKDGRCIMGNKSYYFGVGGNVVGFRQKVQEQGLECKSLFKIVGKAGGNKKQIIQITFMGNK